MLCGSPSMSSNRALDASEVGRPPELPLAPEPLDVRDRLALLPASARRALSLGLNAVDPSFHVFVSVAPEVHLERDLLSALARLPLRRPPALDIVYVPDFDAPDQPVPLLLPAGTGPELAEALSQLVRDVRRRLEAMNLDAELRETDRRLSKDLDVRSKEVLVGVESRAKELGFGVRNVQGSFRTYPILHGKPVSPEQFDVLDERTRKALTEAEEQLSTAVEEAAARVNTLTDEVESARDEVAQKIADRAVGELLTPLLERYASNPTVSSFLERVGDELAHDWRDLFPTDPRAPLPDPAAFERRFRVNVLVQQNPEDPTPPIVFEPDPTHRRLFGYIERRAQQGTLVSSIESIRAGSLLAASGGFLVLRAMDLLDDPSVFGRLKRALRTLAQPFDEPTRPQDVFASTLSPREVPLTTRLVLVGPEELYSMLRSDPDFTALFRVKVEVDVVVDRTEPNLAQLDGFLMALGRERGWLPFDAGARARLLSVATEIAGDREQISLTLPPLEETAAFATHMCRERGAEVVSVQDIDSAWGERVERVTAAAKHLRNPILRGEIFIDTQGSRIGVVNGLAVIPTHDVDLGQPMRITAIVSPGNEGVIDVERESHLGGSIHTKGVVILRGLLGRLFGQERPFSLRAQIAFEQSYGEIDGDSASSAEFFAIISALADVGIDQSLAVTGSVNQLGEMQPIGGVVAKIESFYDLCAARGLTGTQGVILPSANARHVMLRDDIVKAVAEKKFHVHAVQNVAEGIAILTGTPAGERDEGGRFPAASVYGRVERRLIELAERLRNDGGPQGRDSMHNEGDNELAT